MPSLRLAGLIPAAHQANDQLAQLALSQPPLPAEDAGWAALLAQVQAAAARVEALCAKRGLAPSALPVPSRRAYQWLNFLSDPAGLREAAAALRLAGAVLERAAWPRRPTMAGRAVRLAFLPTAYLYHARAEGPEVRVTLAPGYLGAPPEVIEAVLRVALGYTRRAARGLMHSYAAGPEFAELTMTLELATEPPPGSVRGRYYDLDEVFARVNAEYFDGQLARPRLAWSRAVTGRTLGCYQHSSDRLSISQALDDPRVPAYAMDLVMYHELLHKQLGVRVVNGRHYAHTAGFREAERRFKRYAEATAFWEAWRR